MTNKEASQILQEHKDMINNTFPNSLMAINNTEALEIAIKALEQQDKERWIPVNERLPDDYKVEFLTMHERDYMESDLVLVTVLGNKENKFVGDDLTFDGKWVNFSGDEFEVIAWKPMPESFKLEN